MSRVILLLNHHLVLILNRMHEMTVILVTKRLELEAA